MCNLPTFAWHLSPFSRPTKRVSNFGIVAAEHPAILLIFQMGVVPAAPIGSRLLLKMESIVSLIFFKFKRKKKNLNLFCDCLCVLKRGMLKKPPPCCYKLGMQEMLCV